MSYEIPQQLEYKEKIMFGLTFKQLAYLFLFAPQILIIFFKTSFSLYTKVAISLLPSSLAVGFMFLNLDYHIVSWMIWLKFRKTKNQKKITQFIGVKEIKDNLIIMSDKRKLAVLKVQPINFSIKPQGAQESITSLFQKLLNAIDFPIQIIMNTETLDLAEYLQETQKKVESQGNKLFIHLFKKYKEHLESIIAQNKVMNRSFYIIIPEKSAIDIQLSICEKKLDGLNLKSSRLNNEALRKLLDKFFGFPKNIENHPAHIKINNTFNRIIFAHGYPRSVESGFLDKIVSTLGNFDLSLHVEPYPIETMMITLNKELQKQRADLYAAQKREIINPSLEIKYADTKNVLENLQKGKEKLFNVSLYINCRAQNLEELNLLTKRIEAELNSLMIIPKIPQFRMAQGFLSCAPIAKNSLAMKRNITTEALSAFFPFTSSFLQADATGVWLGLNKNNIPIIKDIFKLSNPNGLCLASSGSGKSYMAKLLISRYLLNGVKVMVIDPQGEYKNLVERFNGQRIDLSRTSETMINPLDLMGHEYSEKRLALMDLMPVMLGELTEPQKAFIDRALTKAYEKYSINENSETWGNQPPILEDVVQVLEDMEKRAITLEKTTIRSLINRLRMYTDGVFSFLNKHTKIDFNNNFVCFDIGSMPKQVKPVIMFLVLDYIYMKMREDIQRKLLVIDEAWSLLGRTEDASYIFEIVKTCRKFNLALFLINQEVEGMLSSEAGKSVLANTSYTLLMRQKPAVMKTVQDTFYLSNAERISLLTAEVGEGILLMDDEHSEIKIVASEEEHKLITTKPDEILEQNSQKQKQEKSKIKINNVKQNSNKQEQTKSNAKVSERKPLGAEKPLVRISVDENKGFYKHKDLKLPDIKYLIGKKYKQSRNLNIHGESGLYLLKPRRVESLEHFFLIKDIEDYLQKISDKVELFETTKPDIVFEFKGGKYAIEVDTGKVFTKDKKKLENKIENLKKEYGKRWCFVVTNYRFASSYNQLGKTFTRKNFLKQFPKWLKNT